MGVEFAFSIEMMGKNDALIFEQGKELNWIFRPPALKSARIWGQLMNPLFVAMFVVASIVIGSIAYWNGGLSVRPMMIGICVVFAGQGVSAWGFEQWVGRSPRRLRIDEEGLELKPGDKQPVVWQRIVCFQFEPAGLQREYDKLTVRYRAGDKSEVMSWSMILEKAQGEAVRSALEKRRAAGLGELVLEMRQEPARPETNFCSGRSWMIAFGFASFLCGLLAVLLGVLHLRDHANAKVVHFSVSSLLAWPAPFSHGRDVDRFLMQIGIILIVLGIGCSQAIRMRKTNEAKRVKGIQ